MSPISVLIPTFKINDKELHNLIDFIYKKEQILNEFGVIKIQLNLECKLALKKRAKKDFLLPPKTEQIVKTTQGGNIYAVQKSDCVNEPSKQNPMITDDVSFWSSLSRSENEVRPLNTSLSGDKSFFSQKTSRAFFDIHRLPRQSLLRLGGTKITRQFVPCVRRAYQSGAIFPLTCAQQRLFSIDYHHEGADHHWYIMPARERENLRRVIDQQSFPACLDHGQLFIDPSVLDKNHIHYYQTIQHANEFIVLSAGTFAQSFTYGASWSESILFALPSWIENGHASMSMLSCQCNVPGEYLSKAIDITLFKPELIQRYVASCLNVINDGKSMISAIP